MPPHTFKIGSTSYVYPADLVTNARRLAGLVDDIELVLFDTENYGHNLPDATAIAELNTIAHAHALTYTVHLPVDLHWDDSTALGKVQRAVETTRHLNPFAYVAHLDGRKLMESATSQAVADWQALAAQALSQFVALVGDPHQVCIENVERWEPENFRALVAQAGVRRCVDVGHWWVNGHDPLPHLREHLPQTRVVHLHGVDETGRDHQSLRHMPPAQLHAVLNGLIEAQYTGVVTLEVFGEEDFFSSLDAFNGALAEVKSLRQA